MTNSESGSALAVFPITGAALSDLLSASLASDKKLEISDLETLSMQNGAVLGDLWQRVAGAQRVVIAVRDLADALQRADQIVGLVLRSSEDPRSSLVIEDGEIVENTLLK